MTLRPKKKSKDQRKPFIWADKTWKFDKGFLNKIEANNHKKKLIASGVSARLVSVRLPGGTPFWEVWTSK